MPAPLAQFGNQYRRGCVNDLMDSGELLRCIDIAADDQQLLDPIKVPVDRLSEHGQEIPCCPGSGFPGAFQAEIKTNLARDKLAVTRAADRRQENEVTETDKR